MQLSLSAHGDVVLRMEPCAERAPATRAGLLAWLEEHGWGAHRINEEALERVLREGADASARMVLILAHAVDAEVQVQVARDAMQATLGIVPAQGGAPATEAMVQAALAAAGVVAGIDAEAIAQALNDPAAPPRVVARGVAPVDGRDAQFLELIAAVPDRTPRVDAQGRIDYREHDGNIVLVESGALLMRREPATEGTPGVNVLGVALPARPGRDEPFAPQLSGAAVSEQDPNLLVAAITGQPVLVRAGMTVEPVLRVAEVDVAQGNIRYDGTVHVEGDVAQGMQIHASGDIVVGGTVDGALLNTQGSIIVQGGVIARARLHAECAVQARFAEVSYLRAGTELTVRQNALGCELHALERIAVGAEAPRRGRLVGGSASAMMAIAAPLIGSVDGGLTRLVLGVNPVLQARLQQARQDEAAQHGRGESLRKLIEQLRTHGDPKGVLERAQASLEDAQASAARLQAECAQLQQQLERAREARLEIGVALEGAVDLSLAHQRLALHRGLRAGSVRLDPDGVLVHVDAQGFSEPLQP